MLVCLTVSEYRLQAVQFLRRPETGAEELAAGFLCVSMQTCVTTWRTAVDPALQLCRTRSAFRSGASHHCLEFHRKWHHWCSDKSHHGWCQIGGLSLPVPSLTCFTLLVRRCSYKRLWCCNVVSKYCGISFSSMKFDDGRLSRHMESQYWCSALSALCCCSIYSDCLSSEECTQAEQQRVGSVLIESEEGVCGWTTDGSAVVMAVIIACTCIYRQQGIQKRFLPMS